MVRIEAIEVKEEWTFPVLMKSTLTGVIVLFRTIDRGTVLVKDESHSVGESYADWDISVFKPYTGKVILSNE